MSRVVIVGAGHAGGVCAATLRQYGWDGDIVLIGAESVAPYQRPPLSKAYLKGEAGVDDLKLRSDAFYPEAGIALRLGTVVTELDLEARRVRFGDGDSLAFDKLVIATGSHPRKLSIPGIEGGGVHEMRTIADADAFRAALGLGRRLAVVGGGYVGLEAAAAARSLGAEVVLIEREARCLARVACGTLSTFFEAYHQARGVKLRTGVGVSAIERNNQRDVTGILLDSGEVEPCDAILVGVGAVANDTLARDAGLMCENGVVVDASARTSDFDVFAIGDVTWRPLPVYGDRRIRLESVPNALEQAKLASSAIVGQAPPAPETPWFWSDQYDLKLQIAGVPFGDENLVVRGDPATARFAVFHLRGDRLTCVEAINAPPEFMAGRLLIQSGCPVSADKLADLNLSMKEVAALRAA